MKFIKNTPDKKLSEKQNPSINKFFIENNFEKIKSIAEFFESDNAFMLINGFVGTGKSIVTDCALSYLNDNVIILRYNCFETTTLDDIMLEFFNKFKHLTAQNVIEIPKVHTENFAQKINAYFETIKKPVVIVIDSFEQVLQSESTDVFNFLTHLAKQYNTKTIMISRKFDYDKFSCQYDRVAISALSKNIFEKYLKSEDIKMIGPLSNELYKLTRGYWFYTTLSIKMMKLKKLSLTDFLSEYSNSFLSFNDFILREALSFVNPIDGHLIRFLTVMRHPVSINLLKTLNLYDEDRIKFFTENLILKKYNSLICLSDYYKEISENSIAENIAIKIHKNCVALYETQLPLKPFERDMLISRKTMRREIEYHEMFIPKKAVTKSVQIIDNEHIQVQNEVKELPKTKKEKDEQIRKISFVFESQAEEAEIMDKIAISINDFVNTADKKQKIIEEANGKSLIDLVNIAKDAENKFDYQKVVLIYQYALSLNEDEDYYTFLPKIYVQLGKAFKNLSDWFNSVKYFNLAVDFFNSMGDTQKVNEYKYEIANIYYSSFKQDKAVELIEELLKSDISNNIRIKSELLLSNIKGVWTMNSIPENLSGIEKPVLCELYFKYGLYSDNKDDIDTAIKYYKKCVETSRDIKINAYLSSSLSNLATIYDENGKSDLAIKYLHESIRLDELAGNYNGIYMSSMKLAEIYSFKSKDKAIGKLKDAKKYAEELNDPFYVASCEVVLGDLCAKSKDYKNALRHYKEAYNLAIDNFTKDNITKIETRIREITKVYREK